MADHARQGDSARTASSQSRQIRDMRVRRPMRARVPELAWGIEGPLTTDRKFPWLWLAIDPGDSGYLEHKQIIGFEGKIDSGVVGLWWTVNDVTFLNIDPHEIDSANAFNRMDLATPYIFDPTVATGAWVRPSFDTVVGTAENVMLSCVAIFETVPM
jgi:hypothetical protein